MNYLSVREIAENWKMSARRVQVLCKKGRIEGAQKVGNAWTIPENAIKPSDARIKVETVKSKVNTNILIERVWAMPNKNTFDIKPINDLILEEFTNGKWVDPFANKNKFATITNDLNPNFDTDYHLDALEFLKLFEDESVDGVLYDPPYSPRQVSECYNDVGYNVTWDTTKASFWGNHKREISRIVKKGGKVITFGWNSGGIGYKYGFEITRILIVPHGGWHNDTICTVEIKTHDGIKPISKGTKMLDSKNNESSTDKFTHHDQQLISSLKALPNNFWDFSKDDTREYTHGLHNYPAMMVCPISRNIIRIVKEIMPINSLFDPFSGSGTVLVEGMLAGINNIAGNDINPLARFIAKVKTTPIDITRLQSLCNNLLESIEKRYEPLSLLIDSADDVLKESYGLDLTAKNGWGSEACHYLSDYCSKNALTIEIPNFKNLGYWFKPRVILLLKIIKDEILMIDDKAVQDFALVAFSETIRLVSNRRNGEFKMFRMPAPKVAAFSPNVRQEFRQILNRNIEKMNAFVEAYEEVGAKSNVSIYDNNATMLSGIKNDCYDLIITSPPYGDSRTTVAYGEYSRLSLQWLNLFALNEKDIMSIDKGLMGGKKYRNGFDFTLKSVTLRKSLEIIKDIDIERAGDVYSFYNDLNLALEQVSQKTRSGGYQFWVVGNRTVKNEVLMTDKILAEMSLDYGLEHIYTIDRNISNKVMPSKNSPTNETGKTASTMVNEHIVVLRKK